MLGNNIALQQMCFSTIRRDLFSSLVGIAVFESILINALLSYIDVFMMINGALHLWE